MSDFTTLCILAIQNKISELSEQKIQADITRDQLARELAGLGHVNQEKSFKLHQLETRAAIKEAGIKIMQAELEQFEGKKLGASSHYQW
jgi:hypothetical protein